MTTTQFYEMVNHKSGLLGVSETSSDMRDLLDHEKEDARSAEAVASSRSCAKFSRLGRRFLGEPIIRRKSDLGQIEYQKNLFMTQKMKAAVVEQFGKPLIFQEWDIPTPGPGQILVKTEARGVCHTDVHAWHGDWPVKPTLPFIPGHEAIGTVVAVGSGVTSVKEGERVGVPWLYSACGHCEYCLSAWETVCGEAQFGGYTKNGGFAEYLLADPNYVATFLPASRLPERLQSSALASPPTKESRRPLLSLDNGSRSPASAVWGIWRSNMPRSWDTMFAQIAISMAGRKSQKRKKQSCTAHALIYEKCRVG